jgi:hypothetical protein
MAEEILSYRPSVMQGDAMAASVSFAIRSFFSAARAGASIRARVIAAFAAFRGAGQ